MALPTQLTRIERLALSIKSDLKDISAKLDVEKEQLDRIEQDVNAPLSSVLIPIVTLSGWGIVSVTIGREGETFMATVVKTGGPLKFDVSGFVDDAGNPVVDTDPATYTSSDESIATVVNDPVDPQDGVITLTGTVTAAGATCVITAAFPAQVGGMPFSVVGNLVVIEPAAAGAQAVITGPGVIDGA